MNPFERLITALFGPKLTIEDKLALLERFLAAGTAGNSSISALAAGLGGDSEAIAKHARNEQREIVRDYFREAYGRRLSDGQVARVIAQLDSDEK